MNHFAKELKFTCLWLCVSISPILFGQSLSNWKIAEGEHATLLTNDSTKTANKAAIAATAVLNVAKREIEPYKSTTRQAVRHCLIVIPNNSSSFRGLAPLAQDRTPIEAGGLYMDSHYTPVLLIDYKSEGDNAIYHEFTHHVLHSYFKELPLWAHEGIAELFTTIDARGDRLRFGNGIARSRMNVFKRRGFIPWEAFFAISLETHLKNLQEQPIFAQTYYAQAMLLAHFSFFAHDGRYRPQYFELASRANQFDIGTFELQSLFGMSDAELSAELRKHLENTKHSYREYEYNPNKTELPYKRLDRAQASIYRARILNCASRYNAAQTLLADLAGSRSGLWHSTMSEFHFYTDGGYLKASQFSRSAIEFGEGTPFDEVLAVQAILLDGQASAPNAFQNCIQRLDSAYAAGDRSAPLFEAYQQLLSSRHEPLSPKRAQLLLEGLALHPDLPYISEKPRLLEILLLATP